MYVAVTVFLFGRSITSIAGTAVHFEPLWWFIFYAVSLSIHITGGQLFWTGNFVFALLIVFIEVFRPVPTPTAAPCLTVHVTGVLLDRMRAILRLW
jgi:hypothetical protein